MINKKRLRKLDDCYELVTHPIYTHALVEVFNAPMGKWIDMYSLSDFLDSSHFTMHKRFYVAWAELPEFEKDYKLLLFYDYIRGKIVSANYNFGLLGVD